MSRFPEVDEDLCIGCNVCVQGCPTQCIEVNAETRKLVFRAKETCISCGHCASVCRTAAISMFGILPDTVEEEIMADKPVVRSIKMARQHRFFRSTSISPQEVLRILNIAKYSGANAYNSAFHFTAVDLKRNNVDAVIEVFVTALSKTSKYAWLPKVRAHGGDPIFHGAPWLILISTGHNEDDPKDDGPGLDAFTQAHMLYRDLQLHSEIRGYGTHLCRILQPHLNDVQSLSDSCPNIFDVPQSHTVLLAFVLGIGAMKYHRPLLLPDLVEGIDVTFVE
ncbi:Nitroreductase family protein fused to ferredoxin domain Fd-NR1 [Giardia duodenalis]|uniref:Nitroreductase family protein fused to ferredoxin domain Fd-NR1 n=1 Tax=Giardia intestinalis (strain ATCC 50803 / WB clone C6) TaxID=184922 RepID=A8BRN7_GIAIC|nr:Nitroreductase family protein fused to ferredoxin domain Fd-NR1 [Giardia intestinalis]KAE8305971.1 Nitroreductase family protein fused to ferredoxin domain Fd-NR1 [Giardia intestinalis]|eukprot:XP_001705312.1 Nitroreductase family protein fused to ferredoxin domain Fd-NR1 [Giardia lamblia ATCC 50803]